MRLCPGARVTVAVFLCATAAAGRAPAAPHRERPAAATSDNELERLEVAREHFQRGEQLAAEGKLEAALVELELAEQAHPSTSVTEAKQRVRARLDAQRAATGTSTVGVTAPRHAPVRRFIAPIVIAPLAVGALVAGGALLGTVLSDVDRLQQGCAPACAAADVDPLRLREPLAYGLIGAGAALAVTDIVLWAALATRRERAPTVTALRGAGQGLVGIGGRF